MEVTSISLERLGQPQGLNVCLEGAIKERHQQCPPPWPQKKGLTLDNVVEGKKDVVYVRQTLCVKLLCDRTVRHNKKKRKLMVATSCTSLGPR